MIVWVVCYDCDVFDELDFDLVFLVLIDGVVIWVDVQGYVNSEMFKEIVQYFGLYFLVMEDVVYVFQWFKVDFFDDQFFIVIQYL